jgi:hypothetical protein
MKLNTEAEVHQLNKMAKATPNNKYLVTKDAKMKHLWLRPRRIKYSQLRNVLLLCQ